MSEQIIAYKGFEIDRNFYRRARDEMLKPVDDGQIRMEEYA